MVGCPFEAVARRKGGEWTLDVKKPEHNHEASSIMSHPTLRKAALTPAVSDFIDTETRIHVRPGQILSALMVNNPELPLDIEDIYNEKARLRRQRLNFRTPILALMEELSRHEDWHTEFLEDGVHRLSHLFFSHTESLQLLALNPEVLIMDCTYKTNRFNIPLLNIIGITSLGKNFWVAFCFLRNEKEGDFRWVMRCIRALYRRLGLRGPKIVLTDRALAVINALRDIFPDTKHLLCFWHVNKAVQAYCRLAFETEEEWEQFYNDWLALVNSLTPDDFDTAWNNFKTKWNDKYWRLVDYLDDTWFRLLKTRFVSAWTNEVMHFNTLVTSRGEGSHAVLKRAFGTSSGDLLQVLEDIKLLLTNQLHQYTSRVERARTRMGDHHNIEIFRQLGRRISPEALNLMLKQWDMNSRGPEPPACSGVFHRTTGLLCSHELQRCVETGVLPTPDDIHPHWHLRDRLPDILPHSSLSPSPPASVRADSPAADPVPASEHASGQVLDPQLAALSQVSHIRDPEVIRRQRGGGRGRGRQPESSTQRDYSLFEIVEHAAHVRDRQQSQQASQQLLTEAASSDEIQRARGGRGRAGRGGRGGRRGRQRRGQQQEALEQVSEEAAAGQTTLSQFANFAPVANRLSDMRSRGQRAQGTPSYRGVPEGLVGSFQLASQ